MLTPQSLVYHTSQASSQGIRDSQQDAMLSVRINDYVSGDEWHVLGVFDGVGGHAKGDLASRTAASSFLTAVNLLLWSRDEDQDEESHLESVLRRSLRHANLCVYALGHGHELRPASTAVVAILHNGIATIAHVGDSPAMLADSGRVEVLTRAHSDESGRLSQCLGIRTEIEPGFTETALEDGQHLLLMSDGVSGVLVNDDLVRLAALGSDALVNEALLLGSTDNCTAVCVHAGNTTASGCNENTRDETLELIPGDRVSIGGVRLRLDEPTIEEAATC